MSAEAYRTSVECWVSHDKLKCIGHQLSVRRVDDKLKRIGHQLSVRRVDDKLKHVGHQLSVRRVDDKLKHIGHQLSVRRVDDKLKRIGHSVGNSSWSNSIDTLRTQRYKYGAHFSSQLHA
jgi:hypothetical protein